MSVRLAATVSLLLLLACVPRAWSVTCFGSSAVAPTARFESRNELIGDYVVTCTGGSATPDGMPIPTVDVTLFSVLPITSRPLAAPWIESLLLLDEAAQIAPCQAPDGICHNVAGAAGNANLFQGRESGPNAVVWSGIPLDPPGAGTRTFRLTNVRVDASAAPFTETMPGLASVMVTLTGSGAPTLSNATQITAFVQRGLEFSVRDATNAAPLAAPVALLQCQGATNVRIATLRFRSLYPTAFKRRNTATAFADPTALAPQNVPGAIYNVESGFFDPSLVGNAARGPLGAAGLADSGTRFEAVFSGVPAGVTLYVDTSTAPLAVAKARLTADPAGAFSAVEPTPGGPPGATAVPLANGAGRVAWEVTDVSPLMTATIDLGVYLSYDVATVPLGAATIGGSLGPTAAALIPHFTDGSGAGSGLFEIAAGEPCDALCGGPCDDGDACTSFEACLPGTGCVSPQALTGFAAARCEIGRLDLAALCAAVDDARLAGFVGRRAKKALSLLDRAERASKARRRRKLLHGSARQLPPIDRKTSHRKGVPDECRTIVTAVVDVARGSVDGLQD
jgi:hypothetical protein